MATKDIVIIHFGGNAKPWKSYLTENSKFDEFWFFANLTPFFTSLQNKYLLNNSFRKTFLLFNYIPLLKIVGKNDSRFSFYLFGFVNYPIAKDDWAS